MELQALGGAVPRLPTRPGARNASKAGHANMATTKVYWKLAGVVFREEAKQLERRLLGLSTQCSTHLASPQPTSAELVSHEMVASA